MKSVLTVAAAVLVCLQGCAQIKVDLSDSERFVRPAATQQKYDYKLVVLNRAQDTKEEPAFFTASTHPIGKKVVDQPKDTVEQDIKAFFEPLTDAASTDRRLVVKVNKVDASFTVPGIVKVPYMGLLVAYTDIYPFQIDLGVTCEVEEGGKLVSQYQFAQKFELPNGNTSTDSAFEASYKKIIATYRKTFFEALEQEFIPRYLSKEGRKVAEAEQ